MKGEPSRNELKEPNEAGGGGSAGPAPERSPRAKRSPLVHDRLRKASPKNRDALCFTGKTRYADTYIYIYMYTYTVVMLLSDSFQSLFFFGC